MPASPKRFRASGRPVRPPACVITGGETTVTVRGQGRGGRNQEFALAAAIAIAGLRDTIILSGGTDGTDGPTDVSRRHRRWNHGRRAPKPGA